MGVLFSSPANSQSLYRLSPQQNAGRLLSPEHFTATKSKHKPAGLVNSSAAYNSTQLGDKNSFLSSFSSSVCAEKQLKAGNSQTAG